MTTYAQVAAATKPVVKTVSVETQTEMTWPDGSKQPKKCAVEKQTTKAIKTSSSSQTSASQNDPIKLKISQSKVYLTKQHKESNGPIKQYNKSDAFSDSEMSVKESSIPNSEGWSGTKSVIYFLCICHYGSFPIIYWSTLSDLLIIPIFVGSIARNGS